MTIFAELGLNATIQENIKRSGYKTPTDIQKKSIDRICDVTSNLLDPIRVRLGRNACDTYATSGQLDEEQNVIPHETTSRPYFHGEQIHRGDAIPVRLKEG